MPVLERSERAANPSDHALVSAVRRGDERAFEALYGRYQRRITAYVFGMVKDAGRAEDITQEVFVSALRRMRQTERPIAFKPWIYEIAKNACIDAYRRSRRTEEVSFEADDRLTPADHGRLVATTPGPEAALAVKQELDDLCGAFGGLTESHHEILVMRELEGRSYKDIGERLGMSRPAVESTLFRARKRLSEEYDELASGARCLHIQALIAGAEDARLGLREQRKLARHLSHCQPCRRLAVGAGLEIPVPARRRVADKIGAWLPLPVFPRLRRGSDDPVALGGSGWVAQLSTVSDPMATVWGKVAAGLAALVLAGAGAGVTASLGGDERSEGGAGARSAAERTDGRARSAAPVVSRVAADRAGRLEARGVIAPASRDARGGRSGSEAAGGAGARGAPAADGARSDAPAAGGGDPDAPGAGAGAAGGSGAERTGGGSRAGGAGDAGRGEGSTAPAIDAPRVDAPSTDTGPVDDAAHDAGQAVQDVKETVESPPAITPPDVEVPDVTGAVGQTVPGVIDDVTDAVDDVTGAVGELPAP